MLPCRNYAELSELPDGTLVREATCAHHRSFFDDSRQLKWIIRTYSSRLIPWIKGTHYADLFTTWLQLGLISYTEQEIREFFQYPKLRAAEHSFAWGFYDIARYNEHGYDPTWNLQLWEMNVRCCWRWKHTAGYYYVPNDMVIRFLCSPKDPHLFFKGCEMYTFRPVAVVPDPMTVDAWYSLFDTAARTQKKWLEALIHSGLPASCKQAVSDSAPLIKQIFASPEFATWFEQQKSAWQARIKERLEPVKEGIMATAWHPDRFVPWCLDLEEREDLFGRWDSIHAKIEVIPSC